MTVAKVSLSLDEETLAAAREVAGPRNLSSYVNQAVRRQLQHDRLTALLAEMREESGPIDPALMDEIRDAWPAPE